MDFNLPQNPGLARRLAYGERVRQLHKQNNNNNSLFIRGNNSVFYTALTSDNRINIQGTYEELIELEDIKVGLKMSNVNKNSHVYMSSSKLVLHISLCIICQEYFNEKSDIIREMNCGHPYHLNCIDRWFEDHTFCPICKVHFN